MKSLIVTPAARKIDSFEPEHEIRCRVARGILHSSQPNGGPTPATGASGIREAEAIPGADREENPGLLVRSRCVPLVVG